MKNDIVNNNEKIYKMRRKIMTHMLIRSKLKDFDKWKLIFDEHANIRKAGGSKGYRIFRNIDNPNETIIIFKWDTIENARKFSQSEDLKKRMQEAGVTDIPDFFFLEEVERMAEY